MRRKDREITDFNLIADIIRRNNSAVVSMVDRDKPYGVMVNYAPVMDGRSVSLVFHGAAAGRKVSCLRANPAASVFINDRCAEEVILKGDKPSERSTTHYRSVMLQGTVRLVDDLEEKRPLAKAFLEHFGHSCVEMPPDRALAVTQFFLFTAGEITGKQNPNA